MLAKIQSAAQKMPVVTLVGPRQSGKTTLSKAAFPNYSYVSLERPDERSAAIRDPLGFLARFPDGVIIDEVQRAPELLSYIQVEVDEVDRPGRFILTGSQNFLLMQTVSQTLAGRTAIFTLLPFSMNELYQTPLIEPDKLFNPTTRGRSPVTKKDMWDTIWMGFFPRIHDKKLDPTEWLADYHRTYLERDLRDVLHVMNLDGFDRFIHLAAAQTGQELNFASLAADCGVSQNTVKQWISVLRTSMLISLLPPFYNNYRKRLRKRPKLHFLDTGLVCYLLGIRSAEILRNHPLRGAIFESYVVGEITKAFTHFGKDAPLFHWRDATGHEIDIMIDMGGEVIPIEVKSAMTVSSELLGGMKWWMKLADSSAHGGVLIHGGTACHAREGVVIRPWWIS